jgi:hypothetical protein
MPGCGPASWLCRSSPSNTRTSVSAPRAVVAMFSSASTTGAGTFFAPYRAPSACAITTASEWATMSCTSRATRLRSCSSETSCLTAPSCTVARISPVCAARRPRLTYTSIPATQASTSNARTNQKSTMPMNCCTFANTVTLIARAAIGVPTNPSHRVTGSP